MKAYNLKADKVKLSFGEISAIVLGERGRGRQRTIVPCPENIKDGELVAIAKSRTNKPKVIKNNGTKKEWLARISSEGAYIRNAYGWIGVQEEKANSSKLIASGYGAFGDAGRIGNWDDVLIVIPDNTIVRVKPSRGDAYFLAFADDKVFKLNDREELDLFLDNNQNFELESFSKDNFTNALNLKTE